MNIYEGGYIYENTSNEYIMRASNEVYLPSLLLLDYDLLHTYFKNETVVNVFRIFVLTEDEKVDYEISSDVISANMSITYQSGQRRTLNLTLANQGNKWRYGARENLWRGMKFRLDAGVLIDDTVYWQPHGIFILHEPVPSSDGSNQTISLSLTDKWGLWDGSAFGNTQFKTIIPTQVPMRFAFETIIHDSNGIGGMWDCKPIKFNSQYWDTLTYYTIKQDAGQSIAEPLLSMANTISSDCYYDELGHFNVESNVWEFINDNVPVIWNFDEYGMDCDTPQLKYKQTEYYNQIKTKGAIVNGYQFTGTAQNTNRHSMYNIYDMPLLPKTNSNPKLFSNELCAEQSRYEMVYQSRGLMSVSMTCSCIPFLDVNKSVLLNFPSLGINNEIFIIDSISYNIGSDCKMTISLTSAAEVIF